MLITQVLKNKLCVNALRDSRNFKNNLSLRNLPFNRNFITGSINFQNALNSANKAKTTRNYVVAVGILTLGASFAAVPLYRIFCQTTGFGGTVQHDIGGEKVKNMKPVTSRAIKVKFNSDLGSNMRWQFKPQQKELMVFPGETALAFFTATNPTDEPIIGVSSYNILPFNAAQYFNKIQCFCFEEQLLNPKEQVDMPVFFYIDPQICEDPALEFVDEILLSYTFFEARKSMPFTLSKKS